MEFYILRLRTKGTRGFRQKHIPINNMGILVKTVQHVQIKNDTMDFSTKTGDLINIDTESLQYSNNKNKLL